MKIEFASQFFLANPFKQTNQKKTPNNTRSHTKKNKKYGGKARRQFIRVRGKSKRKMDAETVAVVRQDPEKLTIQKLKSVLSAHGVTLPTTQQHKEFYVKEYRKLVESLLAAFGGSPASAIKTPTSPVVETKKRDRSRSPSPKPRLGLPSFFFRISRAKKKTTTNFK